MKDLNVRMTDETFASLHLIAKEYTVKDRVTGNMRSMTLGEFMIMLCRALAMTERIDGLRKMPEAHKPDQVADYLDDQVRHAAGRPWSFQRAKCICEQPWPRQNFRTFEFVHSVECDEANQ